MLYINTDGAGSGTAQLPSFYMGLKRKVIHGARTFI